MFYFYEGWFCGTKTDNQWPTFWINDKQQYANVKFTIISAMMLNNIAETHFQPVLLNWN